jgi:histidinol-phosphate phosphatase family protein
MARLGADHRSRRVAVFLDRDGVINRRAAADAYIRNWSEFELIPGVVEALTALQEAGATLFVVTNQRGVARGLVEQRDLDDIHARLADLLAAAGVALDGIYTCPHEIGACDCRKPDVGLFVQARAAHPWISFDESHLIGDSISDVEAGHRLRMRLWVVGDDADSVRVLAEQRGMKIEVTAASVSELVEEGSLTAAIATDATRADGAARAAGERP